MNRKELHQSWMEIIRNGGEEARRAWDKVYLDCRDGFVKLIKSKGGTPNEALDAFLAVYEKIDLRIKSEKIENLCAYISKSVFREWKLKFRKKIMEELNDDISILEESPETKFLKAEESEYINKVINSLDAKCLELLLLHEIDKIDQNEIAKIMGYADADSVKTQKWKCKDKIKKYLLENPHINKYLEDIPWKRKRVKE